MNQPLMFGGVDDSSFKMGLGNPFEDRFSVTQLLTSRYELWHDACFSFEWKVFGELM